jgi:hypothetical protein
LRYWIFRRAAGITGISLHSAGCYGHSHWRELASAGSRILAGGAEWGIMLTGVVGIIACGVSVPAAAAALAAWLLAGLVAGLAKRPWW